VENKALLWENLREEEFDAAIEESRGVCVVPIGCLEMHGQHLPVGTDAQTVRYIAEEASRIERVCVFPTIYFGDVSGLKMWKGSIIFSLELLQNMLTELCAEIARNGFKKILILNGHGGNVALLKNFLRSTDHEKKDYTVMFRNEYQFNYTTLVKELDAGVKYPELCESDIEYLREFVREKKTGGHACLNETSIMLKINPEAVRMDRMHEVDGLSRKKTDYLSKKGIGIQGPCTFWLCDHPDSYEGHHPDGATDRIGAAILKKRIELQAEACRLLKADDRVLEWRDEWNKSW
jgi:creatinine amidohydrolase